jgi:hypothetical protein
VDDDDNEDKLIIIEHYLTAPLRACTTSGQQAESGQDCVHETLLDPPLPKEQQVCDFDVAIVCLRYVVVGAMGAARRSEGGVQVHSKKASYGFMYSSSL